MAHERHDEGGHDRGNEPRAKCVRDDDTELRCEVQAEDILRRTRHEHRRGSGGCLELRVDEELSNLTGSLARQRSCGRGRTRSTSAQATAAPWYDPCVNHPQTSHPQSGPR